MRYFIHLAYNGTNYCGWQTQPNLPTVQQTLEQALTTLLRQPVAIVGCGRTASTTWSQTRHSNRTELHPESLSYQKSGAKVRF